MMPSMFFSSVVGPIKGPKGLLNRGELSKAEVSASSQHSNWRLAMIIETEISRFSLASSALIRFSPSVAIDPAFCALLTIQHDNDAIGTPAVFFNGKSTYVWIVFLGKQRV